jgi:hypothetical protein
MFSRTALRVIYILFEWFMAHVIISNRIILVLKYQYNRVEYRIKLKVINQPIEQL